MTVDIAGIRGKLLISPAPGSPAGPAGSSGSGYVMAGAPAASRPWARRGTRTGRKGLPPSSGWTGGWAWKGPGHPVDNGDLARGQRDGLRSEGAARVLFLAAPRPSGGPAGHGSGRTCVVNLGVRFSRRRGTGGTGAAGIAARRRGSGRGISWPALSVTNVRGWALSLSMGLVTDTAIGRGCD